MGHRKYKIIEPGYTENTRLKNPGYREYKIIEPRDTDNTRLWKTVDIENTRLQNPGYAEITRLQNRHAIVCRFIINKVVFIVFS